SFLNDIQTAWGTTLPGWTVKAVCNSEQGITCDASGMITDLNLQVVSPLITGSIPDSISVLTALTYINFNSNLLNGPVPDSISALKSLAYLDLGNNAHLNGSIIGIISALKALTHLDLSSNSFDSSIPDSISALTALTWLNLNSNSLGGPIPHGISALIALQYLNLGYNSLTGSIPDSISALTVLTLLNLGYNSLTGSIPDSISALTALTYLSLYTNQLTGLIPATLGSLSLLDYLNTDNNSLTCPAADSTTCGQTLSSFAAFCRKCSTTCSTCQEQAASGGGGGVSIGAIIGIAVAAVVVLLLLLAAMLLCFRRQKQRSSRARLMALTGTQSEEEFQVGGCVALHGHDTPSLRCCHRGSLRNRLPRCLSLTAVPGAIDRLPLCSVLPFSLPQSALQSFLSRADQLEALVELYATALQSCLSCADELEALVELHAGPQRMTPFLFPDPSFPPPAPPSPSLQENKALQEAAEKLPPSVSPQAVAFTKRALLTLQNNPSWSFAQKQKMIGSIVRGFSSSH
ncbi:unnamed protein product, partial [Closterium sp. Naga37s-1]